MIDARSELLSMRDDANASFASSLAPCGHEFLGARIPDLRRLARRIAADDWRGYLEAWSPEFFEDYMLRGLVTAYARTPLEERLALYRDFIPFIDNWSVCDSFCSTWKPRPEEKDGLWGFLEEQLDTGEEFRVRLALVMMMSYYLEDRPDDVLAAVDRAGCGAYYAMMARAWCLATALAVHPERTMAYLEGDNRLDAETMRMTVRKGLESYRVDDHIKDALRALGRRPKN